MTTASPAITGAVVTPYRFSDRPREVVAFLELLGMRTFLRQDDFVVLAGRSGRIAVHPLATATAAHQSTTLVLGVPDATVAADALLDAGQDATWWDESWGRQVRVLGPVGALTLDAEVDDPYGYDVAESPPARDSGVDVVATIYATDLDEVAAYFALFGLRPGPDSSPDWRSLRAGDRSGIVGLMAGTPAPDTDGVSTEIGFETTEPLHTLTERLRAAGHPVTLADDAGPRHLLVTDPDGVELEVYAAT